MHVADESSDWCRRFVACDATRLKVFATWRKAARHVADHLLTHPEARGWSLLVPGDALPIDLADRERCWELSRRLDDDRAAPGPVAKQLYDAYAEQIRRAAGPGSAAVGTFPRGTAYLGLSGVIVIAVGDTKDQVVATAFLGGQGSAEAVIESRREKDSRSGRSRQSGFADAIRRRDRPQRGHAAPQSDVLQVPSGQREDGSRERQIYLRLFRASAQFVRRQQLAAVGLASRGNDYAVLKEPLGPMSRWDFETWSRQWTAAVTDKTSGETP
ncbi:MAG TPA: hypothetical protein DCQ98_19935 [Planctomycetaceae bacterium]|nr:hypothetical protein [Planctomycetaceae bacterium]HRF00064.1 hypothetical protein [Pirellulaceae bacterium]